MRPRAPHHLPKSPGQHGERTIRSYRVDGRRERLAVGDPPPGAESQHLDPLGTHDLAAGDHQHRQRPGPSRHEGHRLRGRPDLPGAGVELTVRQCREAIDAGALGEHQAADHLPLRRQPVPCVSKIGRGRIEQPLQGGGLVYVHVSVDQQSRRRAVRRSLITGHCCRFVFSGPHRLAGIDARNVGHRLLVQDPRQPKGGSPTAGSTFDAVQPQTTRANRPCSPVIWHKPCTSRWCRMGLVEDFAEQASEFRRSAGCGSARMAGAAPACGERMTAGASCPRFGGKTRHGPASSCPGMAWRAVRTG